MDVRDPARAPAPARASDSTSARRWLWLLLLPAAALLHAWLLRDAGPMDDEYIVYRYARNWVEGLGLVFQEGERVEGYTVPLYLLLIAAGLRVGLAAQSVGLFLGLLGVGVSTWAVARIWFEGEEEHGPRALRWPLPAVALALAPGFAWHGVVGLGTTLLAALLALWFLELRRARLVRAGIWLALACLLRQECALFVPAFAWHARRRPVACTLPLVALAGWTLFRLAYYGSWLPVTYAVKKLPLLADLEYGVLYLGRATVETGLLVFVALALGWGVRLAAVRESAPPTGQAPRGRGVWNVLLAGLVLHLLYVVYVGGDFVPRARFFQPVLPLWVLAACELVARLRTPLRPALAALIVLGPLWVHLPLSRASTQQLAFAHGFFEERWAELGRNFGETLPPGTLVGISPIGAFGWYSRLPLVDLLGLTNDAVLEAEPDLENTRFKGHHRSDAEWALERRPAIFVLGNGVLQPDGQLAINPWEAELYGHPRFQAEYELRVVPVPGGEPLPCFVRRG